MQTELNIKSAIILCGSVCNVVHLDLYWTTQNFSLANDLTVIEINEFASILVIKSPLLDCKLHFL